MYGLNMQGLLCPGKRQGLGDERSLTLFQERDEVEQASFGIVQLEPQMTPHAQRITMSNRMAVT